MTPLDSVVRTFRHELGRKLDKFEDVKGWTPATISAADVEILGGIVKAKDYGITSPLDDGLSDILADQMVFVLEYEGMLYLVNTEGVEPLSLHHSMHHRPVDLNG